MKAKSADYVDITAESSPDSHDMTHAVYENQSSDINDNKHDVQTRSNSSRRGM